ncbi:MAG: hypothetical protein ACO1RT_03430 [Planctomycetaceae bacterium]
MTPDTGNLATISFPESGFTAKFVQIGEVEKTIEALNASALDTVDDEELIPSDLAKNGVLEAEFWFDTEIPPPDAGEADVPVITFPTREGETTPASYTGSGFFLNKLMPMLKNGELQKGKAKFQFDGRATKMAFTPAVSP